MKKRKIFYSCCAIVLIIFIFFKGEYLCAIHSKDCRKWVLSPERDVSVETFLKIVDYSYGLPADYLYDIQADCYIYLLEKYNRDESYKEKIDRNIIFHLFGCYTSLHCSTVEEDKEAYQIHKDVFNISYPGWE